MVWWIVEFSFKQMEITLHAEIKWLGNMFHLPVIPRHCKFKSTISIVAKLWHEHYRLISNIRNPWSCINVGTAQVRVKFIQFHSLYLPHLLSLI